MITNHYESVVIINAALDDTEIEAVLSKIDETIKVNGGEITNLDKWGRKRLAYPIQKSKSGYYAVYRFTAPTDLIEKLERQYRLDENIVRYLTIVLNKKDIEHYTSLDKEQDEKKTVEVVNKEEEKETAAAKEEKEVAQDNNEDSKDETEKSKENE